MKVITIEELEKLAPGEATIVDVRPEEEFRRGTFEGAINIPMKEFSDRMDEIPKDKPVWLLCHTGERSVEYVELLCLSGYDAGNVEGGYRAFLRLQLGRFISEEDIMKEKTKEIERSLIKKFRKSIWRAFTKAVQKYDLIQPGDKIAVCISGGKDSMLMAKLLQELQRHGKYPFELVFLVMNPGYNADNWKIIQDNAKVLGIPLTVFESDIFNIVAEVDKNPCYLCARMRRGYLYSHAKELGCNKIAYAHHKDDIIETMMLSLIYEGRFHSFSPKTHLDRMDLTVIRPLMYVQEADIIGFKNKYQLPVIKNPCLADGSTKREYVKNMLRRINLENHGAKNRMFTAIVNGNLEDWPAKTTTNK